MDLLALITFWIVIVGHVVFAAMQAFYWPFVALRLLAIEDPELVECTRPMGASFASYNFSIAVGLAMSLLLPEAVRQPVQLTVLGLIVFTAIVGYSGTKSLVIAFGRLLPAALGFLLILV